VTALPASLARTLVLAFSASVLALPVATASPASADPKPADGIAWPRCGSGDDTDGKYCIESVTADGVEFYPPDGSVDTVFDQPEVDLLGPGEVRFGVELWQVVGGQYSAVGGNASVDPTTTWQITANVRSIDLVEMTGSVRDPLLSLGGDATSGYTFTLTFTPTPMAIMEDYTSCTYADGCGDDDTVATLVYGGFASGKLTDDTDMAGTWTPAEINRRRGYVTTSNAQEASWRYDLSSNTMVVEMANPHLRAVGEPAVGYFDVVVPDALLINEYSVPDPTALTAGSLTVKRTGSSAPVDFTVTREAGGVRLKVDDITFSTPQFKIHPKVSAPGAPRWGSVTRPHKKTVKVTFRKPLANGGSPIKAYKVQCARGAGAWTMRLTSVTPAVFPNMTPKPMTCKVRAINAEGRGPWSTPRIG